MRRQILWYNPKLTALARKLRNNSTKSEIFLWKCLKGKRIYEYDFHRQKPIDNYIIDFFCHELKLAIEIDGYSHYFPDEHIKDMEKDIKLNTLGINVLQFEDSWIFHDLENVLRTIEKYIEEYELTHPRPLSRGESGQVLLT